MNNIIYACLVWQFHKAQSRDDGMVFLSNLLSDAWDKVQPQNQEESVGLGVLVGSMYDRLGEITDNVRATRAEVLLVTGYAATYDQFYAEALRQIAAEDSHPDHVAYLQQVETESANEVIIEH